MPTTLKGPAAARAEMNVTPLIDVLLVLVIIFILIKLLEERLVQDVQVPPPAATTPPARPTFQIILDLTSAGGYAVNEQPVPATMLRDYLRQSFADRATKLLFIKAAPTRTYQDMIDAMSMAREVGVQVIGIVPASPH